MARKIQIFKNNGSGPAKRWKVENRALSRARYMGPIYYRALEGPMGPGPGPELCLGTRVPGPDPWVLLWNLGPRPGSLSFLVGPGTLSFVMGPRTLSFVVGPGTLRFVVGPGTLSFVVGPGTCSGFAKILLPTVSPWVQRYL